jgi:formylglycine-generating enzyme required for sulfatase activity
VVALALLLAGLWAGGVFRVKTPNGTIVIANVPADAEVQIDGNNVIVSRNGETVTVTTVAEGPHRLKVVKGGQELWSSDVTVKLGGDPLRLRMEPRDARMPNPDDGGGLPKTLKVDLGGGVDMEFVLLNAKGNDEFLMGAPIDEEGADNDEKPQHWVRFTKPFYLAKYIVTQEQYERLMGRNPSHFSATGGGKEKVAALDKRRFPVETVSWEEAVDFCRRLSKLPEEKRCGRVYRLPTEAEWEYACRAGASSSTPFPFSTTLSSTQANFNGNFPYGGPSKGSYLERTTAVGSYPANAWGLYDMHGNVWQWCSDRFGADYYTKSPREDPVGPSEDADRVARGGSWFSGGRNCRSASRNRFEPATRSNSLGFRVALIPSGK